MSTLLQKEVTLSCDVGAWWYQH